MKVSKRKLEIFGRDYGEGAEELMFKKAHLSRKGIKFDIHTKKLDFKLPKTKGKAQKPKGLKALVRAAQRRFKENMRKRKAVKLKRYRIDTKGADKVFMKPVRKSDLPGHLKL